MTTQSDAFISKYREAAEKIAKETGVPAARILAQAGFETGWNVEPPGKNFFGVKAQPGYEGKSQVLDTHEADANGNLVPQKQPFRVYDNPEDSFRDFANVLKQDNFKGAINPNLNDAQYAQTLQAGGYGTDPAYAAKLHGAIGIAREGLGQAPDGSTVALAQAPTQTIGTPPAPAMQMADVPATATATTSAIPGLLTSMLTEKKKQDQQAQTQGLLAAGQPAYTPSPPLQLPGLLALRQLNPNAAMSLPKIGQRGLLG